MDADRIALISRKFPWFGQFLKSFDYEHLLNFIKDIKIQKVNSSFLSKILPTPRKINGYIHRIEIWAIKDGEVKGNFGNFDETILAALIRTCQENADCFVLVENVLFEDISLGATFYIYQTDKELMKQAVEEALATI